MQITKGSLDQVDQLKEMLERIRAEREDAEQLKSRNKLREFATQLREPAENNSLGPASTSTPSFKLTQASSFPHVTERIPSEPGSGQLSPAAERTFLMHMSEAAKHPDAATRDRHVSKAAQTVSKDWDAKHGHTKKDTSLLTQARQEARAQAVFVAREIGEKIGLGPAQSTIIGHALERALEKEGFKVMASYAVDKASDVFKASSAAISKAVGNQAAMEATLNKSLTWLAEHGVSKEAIKDSLKKHAGKLVVLAEMYEHPEAFKRAAQVISSSDKAIDAVVTLSKDDDLRKAVGNLTLATGEAIASVNKGIGSAAILTGSALRGDSADETGRHAFRAALAIAGGAVGGAAAGSVSFGAGSVVGAVAGSAAGSALADKLLDAYDKFKGTSPAERANSVSSQELKDSSKLIGDRLKSAGSDAVNDRIKDLGREYSMGSGMR